jgi:hypothetical protein
MTADVIDPAFFYAPGGRLMPVGGLDNVAAWRHLCALVARDPLDLESQTRRVLLACQPGMQERLFGALVDLFLALGSRGHGLRRQLLEQAHTLLDPDDEQFLQRHLERGLPRDAALPEGSGSVLDAAVMGVSQMVGHSRSTTTGNAGGPLAQAVDMLDNGDLAGARALLEAAVLEAPADVAMVQELQTIYRHSRDDAGRAAMVQRLQARWGEVPELWR